jgi:hypothetical protein
MLSLESVKDIAQEAAREAEEEGREPSSIKGFDPAAPRDFIRRIPFLGDYIPRGWEHPELIDDLFVDSSGQGSDYEPALSVNQFAAKLHEFQISGINWGFGISQAGEFQVYIRIYRQAPLNYRSND